MALPYHHVSRSCASTIFNFFAKRKPLGFWRSCSALILDKPGDPQIAVVLKDHKCPIVGAGQVRIKVILASINPADINIIEGKYPLAPSDGILGNEGLGQVVEVGENVSRLVPGDWVIPSKLQPGMWRTSAVFLSDDLIKVDNQLDPVLAATLGVNPCTAYRMLMDFLPEEQRRDSVVIQSGANSGVGQAVIQIASQLGMKTVNIIRQRENIEETAVYLKSLGGDHVYSDKILYGREINAILEKVGRPKLALDMASGKQATGLARALTVGGTLVLYGAMSKEPLTLPVSSFIFRDLRVRGFWLSQWYQQFGSTPRREEMLQFLTQMALAGHLRPPRHRIVPFKDYKFALRLAATPFTNSKVLLDFRPS